MSARKHWLTVAWLLALAASSMAQDNMRLSVSPPKGFTFQGNWQCTGSFQTGTTHRAIYQGEVILGGTWLQLTEEDIEPATKYMGRYLIGYDPQKKRIVEFDANTFGASVYSSDAGWHDRTLTLLSQVGADAGQPYALDRFVYRFDNPHSFTVTWETSKTEHDPVWTVSDRLSCSPVPARR